MFYIHCLISHGNFRCKGGVYHGEGDHEVLKKLILAAFTLILAATLGAQGTNTNEAEKIGGAELSKRLVHQVKPVYPPEAKQSGVEGKVILEVVVDRAGDVTSADVVSGPEPLIDSAVTAVRQWKYKPAEVAVKSRVDINYTLTK
jgi:TonB family protein